LSSREQTLSAPDLIAASKCWARWKYRGTGLVRPIVITLEAATLPAAAWGSAIRWGVPVAEVSALQDPRRAREACEKAKTAQRPFASPQKASMSLGREPADR
jgi:hypothetical protein